MPGANSVEDEEILSQHYQFMNTIALLLSSNADFQL